MEGPKLSATEQFVGSLYADLAPCLAESGLYLNLGFWRDAPATHDAASEALARLLAETATLGPHQVVLDVGVGLAAQDVFWVRQFGVASVVGLDVSPPQLERARAHVAASGLADRIDLRPGSATAMPIEGASVDRVLALESAFHFRTREQFFAEAHRVLRNGGRIATADIVALPRAASRLGRWYHDRVTWHDWWWSCRANLYPLDVYARKLEEAGFEDVQVTSIREHVWAPWARHLHRRARLGQAVWPGRLRPGLLRVWDPAVRNRLSFLFSFAGPMFCMRYPPLATAALDFFADSPFDYVVAVGTKRDADQKPCRGSLRDPLALPRRAT
jgi:cyclopropane fatty-acyl-phospholipid synthase-like methyltransferase